MTYAQIRNLAVQSAFIDQVRVAITTAAINISSEAPETANHANRVAYALAVLRSPGSYAAVMAEGAAQDSNVQAAPTDANIMSAVAGQWNAYAGTA
jgi:hypothetical protein